jgi:hypothetical protein
MKLVPPVTQVVTTLQITQHLRPSSRSVHGNLYQLKHIVQESAHHLLSRSKITPQELSPDSLTSRSPQLHTAPMATNVQRCSLPPPKSTITHLLSAIPIRRHRSPYFLRPCSILWPNGRRNKTPAQLQRHAPHLTCVSV